MPSARQFCREGDYPIAIFLTYSLDPLFFERVPWADLRMGGGRRIVIAADAGQVADAMRRNVGQLAYLGRRYVLADTVAADIFHPKLIARLSEDGGHIWIGSGNLTYTGWGGNRELAVSWPIGPEEDDSGAWLDDVLGAVNNVIRSTTFADQLRDIRAEIPWLTRTGTQQRSPVLLGRPGQTLAAQLAGRWAGRHFDELHLCTGSTDVDGSFLAWAHRTFGIQRATVCLSPAYASFDPESLAKLPFNIRIITAAPEQYLHAKFYWFSGPEGNAAVIGSANCSAAAWLAGNIELVVPYDEPRARDFESVLSIFKGPKKSPAKVLAARLAKSDPPPTNAPRHRLVSLRLRSAYSIEALVDPPLAPDAQAHLVIHAAPENVRVRLALTAHGLTGRISPEAQLGLMTLFAHVEAILDGAAITTEPRWIDNDALLERAAQVRAVDTGLQELSRRSVLGMDGRRILEAIQTVSAQLLDPHRGGYQHHSARSALSESGTKPYVLQAPLAVDPSLLIRNLNELRRNSSASFGARGIGSGGGLSGVIAMLFETEEPDDIDLTRETWSAAEPEKNPDEPEPPPPSPPPRDNPSTSDAASSPEALAAFRDEIDLFLDELGKLYFATTCDAPRMVQALAFPLLVCVRGGEAGWLPHTELAAVATRVADIMFNRIYERGNPAGLLAIVQQRYEKLGRLEDFRRTVGDGTLWTALLAALFIDPGAPLRTVLPQASALASVFNCRELLSNSDAAQLSSLIRCLLIRNAERQISEKAEKIALAITTLTAKLSDEWDAVFKQQGSGRRLQPANTLLWSRNWGWHVTATSPAEAYHSGYIRVESAAVTYPEIQRAVSCVLDACR